MTFDEAHKAAFGFPASACESCQAAARDLPTLDEAAETKPSSEAKGVVPLAGPVVPGVVGDM